MIGDKLQKFRKQAKLSQFQLELEVGISPGSISRIENYLINPTKETLLKIADYLNLSLDEKIELFDFQYSEIEKYIPSKFLKQELIDGESLNSIINIIFKDYALLKGKDYFIQECDSSLDVPSKEVYYLQNIFNWRKVYSEESANTNHVPKRIDMKKFAKFLINSCEEGKEFQSMDKQYFRETRLIQNNSQFAALKSFLFL